MAVAQDALTETQAQANDQLRAQLLAAVTAIYGVGIAADMLTNPAALVSFLRRLVPLSLAAQAQMVRSTTLNLARQLPLDRPIVVKPTDLIGAKLRGAPIEQVYSRAVYDIEDRLDAGDTFADAVDFGLHRVTQNAVTDLQLARTHAAQAYAGQLQDRVPVKVGIRRVLKGTSSCALCILASTRIYWHIKTMAIHPGCDCDTELVFEDEEDAVNAELNARYSDVHNIVADQLGEKYRDTGGRTGLAPYKNIIITHEHGELGPVLGVRDHKFEGPQLRHRRIEDERVQVPLPHDRTTNTSTGDSHGST
jgi:hypothetical protein